jgi:hypothetical protein
MNGEETICFQMPVASEDEGTVTNHQAPKHATYLAFYGSTELKQE